jgi:hypothetical protein
VLEGAVRDSTVSTVTGLLMWSEQNCENQALHFHRHRLVLGGGGSAACILSSVPHLSYHPATAVPILSFRPFSRQGRLLGILAAIELANIAILPYPVQSKKLNMAM